VRDREWWGRIVARVALAVLAVLYLAFMVVSHHRPFATVWQVPLALSGWLLAMALLVVNFRRYLRRTGKSVTMAFRPGMRLWPGSRVRWRAGLRGRRGLAVFGLLIVLVLGFAAAEGLTGDRFGPCMATDPGTCARIDNWRQADGAYFRQMPYDAAGDSDPGAPWVRVSRAEYIAGTGTVLRSAALFGVLSLALGLLLTVMEEGTARVVRAES
jgi:hypothetical protein